MMNLNIFLLLYTVFSGLFVLQKNCYGWVNICHQVSVQGLYNKHIIYIYNI